MNDRGNKILRFLDRFFGIPLIWIFGLFHKKRNAPDKIESIAFLKTAGIGDTVLLSGIILDIKKAYPHSAVTLFTGTSNYEMGQMIHGITVIALPMTHPFKCLKMIRKQHYDIWIDFDPWPRINALFSFFAKAAYTIGFRTPKQKRHFAYDSAIDHSFARHELENYRALLAPLRILGEHVPSVQACRKPVDCKVALHFFSAGSRAALKEWPQKNWNQLIDTILALGCSVVLTGSKKDRVRLEEFSKKRGVKNLAGTLSLQETASELTSLKCLVTIDTGIMHLAAALDCPVIALHGPTSPHRWGAIGKRVIALTPSYPYSRCIQLGFEKTCTKSHCMNAITVESVIETLKRVLGT